MKQKKEYPKVCPLCELPLRQGETYYPGAHGRAVHVRCLQKARGCGVDVLHVILKVVAVDLTKDPLLYGVEL